MRVKTLKKFAILMLSAVLLVEGSAPISTQAATKPGTPKISDWRIVGSSQIYPYANFDGEEQEIAWSKVKNADGYQVEKLSGYYDNGKWKHYDDVTGAEKSGPLKEKYYTKSTSYSRAGSGGTDSSIVIRVRAYKVTKGKKVFGKWSNRKKVNGYYAWSD